MWNNKEVKSYAKDFLRRHYCKAFVVCLIVSLVSGGANSGSDNNNNDSNYNNNSTYEQDIFSDFENNGVVKKVSPIFKFATNRGGITPFSFIGMGVVTIMTVVLAILFVTVGYALEVGRSRFFLLGFEGDARIGEMFSMFNATEYLPIIKTQFLRAFYTFLWTLLFIVPGIIKSYEYRFVPYILAEEHNISSKEAMALSKQITMGHKMRIWGLDVSFIGWYILGALALGVGIFFVDPYHEAANARLYNILSGNGRLDEEKSLYNEYGY